MSVSVQKVNNAQIRDNKLDAVKGFLILCIVLEHNTLLTAEYDWIRAFCDAFAAGAFLILTFLRPVKVTSWRAFCEKYLSYLVPFFWVALLLAIANFYLYTDDTYLESTTLFFEAIMLASPSGIKESTGFMYIWFLPCIFALYFFKFIHQKIGHVFLVLFLVSFLCVGTIDDSVLVATPYSLHVIAFIYILGMIFSRVHPYLVQRQKVGRLLSVTLFVIMCIMTSFIGWELFLAGGIIPSWREPLLLFFYGAMLVLAIPCLYNLFSFLPEVIVKVFALLGENSLIIYLAHPVIFFLFFRMLMPAATAMLSLILTISISLLLSIAIGKSQTMTRIVFPKKLTFSLKGR